MNVTTTTQLSTHWRYIEGSNGVLCQVLHFFQGDLNIPVGGGAIRWPVLVTFDLLTKTQVKNKTMTT